MILLHGLGADGNDLIGLAQYWASLLPTAEFLSPNAPFPCDMAPYGYQWFSAQDRSPAAVLAGVRAAAPFLDAFIDDALAKRGFDEADLALVGFSQGTMMSLFVGLRRSKPVAGMAALRLVEQGKLSLDTDINTWLTSWKLPADPVQAGKPVTLRELLTHTGGITVHGFPGYASGEPVPTLIQVLNAGAVEDDGTLQTRSSIGQTLVLAPAAGG